MNILIGTYPKSTDIEVYNSLDDIFNKELIECNKTMNFIPAVLQATNNSIVRMTNVYCQFFYASNFLMLELLYSISRNYDYYMETFNGKDGITLSSYLSNIKFFTTVKNGTEVISFEEYCAKINLQNAETIFDTFMNSYKD